MQMAREACCLACVCLAAYCKCRMAGAAGCLCRVCLICADDDAWDAQFAKVDSQPQWVLFRGLDALWPPCDVPGLNLPRLQPLAARWGFVRLQYSVR